MSKRQHALKADQPAASTRTRGTVLVVDDSQAQRLLLRSLLEAAGYAVVEAADGELALSRFAECRPDIVFMDVVMPRMDGVEATRRIKALSAGDFVPVVFITSLGDESLSRCIEAGGDDILIKPCDPQMVQHKVHAMMRIRTLHREMSELHQHLQREHEIAEQVLSSAVSSGNAQLPLMEQLLRPVGTFSGDLLLVGYGPSGDLHLVLGDFTGHGLSAALGALPASQVFRAMLAKGFPAAEVMAGINNKLHQLLPTGLFMAATYVVFPARMDRYEVCNCGMPEGVLLDAERALITQRVESSSVPLGVLQQRAGDYRFHSLPATQGARLVLFSDGVIEAYDSAGEAFGQRRFENLICTAPRGAVVATVSAALERFCAGEPQADDISMVVLPCEPDLLAGGGPSALPSVPVAASSERPGGWEASITQRGSQLDNGDAIPGLISQVQSLGLLDAVQLGRLLRLLGGMYDAVLDYGLLGLCDPQASLTARREARVKRLAPLDEGWLRIDLCLAQQGNVQRLCVRISHNGGEINAACLNSLAEGCGVPPLTVEDGYVEAACSWVTSARP